MSNEEPIAEKVDESLASQMGDPTGQPQAVEAKDPVLKLIGGIGITVVVVGGLLLPAVVSTRPCMGATRSAKTKWEQRQHEVDQAWAAHESQQHE
jgi:hypothetical protein